MKKQLLSVLTITSAMALASVPTAVHADTGLHTAQNVVTAAAAVWDYKGSESETFSANQTRKFEKIIDSGGGDFKVKVTKNEGGGILVIQLYETDSGTNLTGTYIGSKSVTGTGEVVFDVRDYVDGLDGKAELWVKITNSGPAGNVSVEYYD